MKILVICQYYYPEPFHISNLCEMLARLGHEVTVLTGLPNYPVGKVPAEYLRGKKRRETINGVSVYRSYEIGRGKGAFRRFLNYVSFALSGSLLALRLQVECDVVFVYQLSPVLMVFPAMVIKKLHRKKVVLYCLDLWPESLAAGGIRVGSFVYTIFLHLSRLLYRSADLIMVTSDKFRDYFRDVLLLPNDIRLLPQYADDVFSDNLTIPDSNIFNFVFAGNVGVLQSVETIVLAARELGGRSDVMFHIVGDGSMLESCSALARNSGVLNIRFHGRYPIEDMPRFYRMASAMLVTLKEDRMISETLPGKVQSYLAAGKPILGAVNGAARRLIEEADCGFCCDAEDHCGLAKLVNQFCDLGIDETMRMGKNARSYYESNFGKERFVSCLLEALHEQAER